jgi:hypothetical protein
MSITDLEVLCEVLDSPAIRLHYFTKRTTWECTMAYVGDEEDLLVYYLSEGLVRPEEYALENAMPLWMYGLSDQLHNYYMAEWCGMGASAEKPRRHLTKWWRSLLERIEALRAADRWRIACALLDFPYREQQAFESQLEAIVNNVRREGNDCGENGLVCAAPDRSEAVVVGFAYRNMDFDERNDRAEDLAIKARESTGACEVVVIGIDTDIPSKSYDSLRFFRFTS